MSLSTKSPENLASAAKLWPGVRTGSNRETAATSRTLFLCVKPLQIHEVLTEIRDLLRPDQYLISIAGCVTLREIESFHPGPVTKFIPTLVSEVGEGISLCCHNPHVTQEQKKEFHRLASSISTVKEIRETDFEAATDLTSCAPGLFAGIFDEFLRAGLRASSLSENDAKEMVSATLSGFAKLLKEKNWSFNEVIEKVATKGGITQEGVAVFREALPAVFDRMFARTLEKHALNKAKIRGQFYPR